MRGQAAVTLSFVLLAAATAAAEPGQGNFRASDGLQLEGLGASAFASPYLTAVGRTPGEFSFELVAGEIEVDRAWSEVLGVRAPNPVLDLSFEHYFEVQEEVVVLAEVRASSVSAKPAVGMPATLVAWGEDAVAQVDEQPLLALTLREPGRADPFFLAGVNDGPFWAEAVPIPHPHFESDAPLGVVELRGDFTLYLFNVVWEAEHADGTRLFRTGYETGETGRDVVERNLVHVRDGRLTISGAAELRSASFDAPTNGRVFLREASGSFDQSRSRYEARDVPAMLEGAFQVSARAVDGGASGPIAFVTLTGDLRRASLAPSERPGGGGVEVAAKGAAFAGGALVLVAGSVLLYRRRETLVPGLVDDPAQCVERALAAQAAGKHRVALRWYRRARALAPQDALLALDVGLATEAVHADPSAARRAYEEALRLDPDLAEGHLRYARVLAAEGMQPAALSHLGRAFALDPALAPLAAGDEAFAAWRDHPRFADLLRHYRAA